MFGADFSRRLDQSTSAEKMRKGSLVQLAESQQVYPSMTEIGQSQQMPTSKVGKWMKSRTSLTRQTLLEAQNLLSRSTFALSAPDSWCGG